jgi:hypothetical protein
MPYIVFIEDNRQYKLLEKMALRESTINYRAVPVGDEYFANFLNYADLEGWQESVGFGVKYPVARKVFTLHGSQLTLFSHAEKCMIKISMQEYRLLQAVARTSEQLISRKKLIEALGGNYLSYDERCLEKLLSRLRKKLAFYGFSIRAIKSRGYWFEANVLEEI